jgi:hypothetical protein
LTFPDDVIRAALAKFGGVKRRFTRVGEWNGAQVIDDYGHHPVEIAAVLKAARESTKGQVIAVVQPHRYTRLKSLFEPFSTCFNDADAVIVAHVYPAGEQPIAGADRDGLVAALRVMREPGHQGGEVAVVVDGFQRDGHGGSLAQLSPVREGWDRPGILAAIRWPIGGANVLTPSDPRKADSGRSGHLRATFRAAIPPIGRRPGLVAGWRGRARLDAVGRRAVGGRKAIDSKLNDDHHSI